MVALRRVDARNGGPVSVDSAVAGATYDLVRQAATSWLSRARLRREHERLSPLQAQMKEIRRTYAGNREEEQKALMEFYKTNRMSPFPGCAWAFAHVLAATTDLPRPGDAHGRHLRPVFNSDCGANRKRASPLASAPARGVGTAGLRLASGTSATERSANVVPGGARASQSADT